MVSSMVSYRSILWSKLQLKIRFGVCIKPILAPYKLTQIERFQQKLKKWISKFSQLHSWPPRATAAAYSEGAQALGDAMQSNYNELAHHEQRRFWKVQNQKRTDLQISKIEFSVFFFVIYFWNKSESFSDAGNNCCGVWVSFQRKTCWWQKHIWLRWSDTNISTMSPRFFVFTSVINIDEAATM